jgi:hypothetical protein
MRQFCGASTLATDAAPKRLKSRKLLKKRARAMRRK